MICHYCGAELKDSEIFCGNCGTRRAQLPAPRRVEPVPAPASVEEILPRPEPAPVACVPCGTPERTVHSAPVLQLPTSRGLGKMIFLGILTLGIYPLVIWCRIVTELNIVASRYDGERTMSFLGAMMLSPITLGTFPFVWFHDLCRRMGAELSRRGICYDFGASSFWLWGVLGSFILVGPFVFVHKLMKSMNLLNGDFNLQG